MYNVKKVLEKIINTGYKVKINYRLVNGKYVLFLNYRKSIDGNKTQETKRVATLNGKSKQEDLNVIKSAMELRAEYEKNLDVESSSFKIRAGELLVADYFDYVMSKHSNKSTVRLYKCVKKHFINYAGENMLMSQIDKRVCFGFMEYLPKNVAKSGRLYLSKFKTVLNRAINEEILSDMPYLRKMNLKQNSATREMLDINEIELIYKTPTDEPDYINAFVFSCFTGLRFIDLYNLKHCDIVDGKVKIIQQKTDSFLEVKLGSVALEILEKQGAGTGKVFNLKDYFKWNTVIKEHVKKAGITRNITGHCARHSFASLLIENDVDILTVSKLMGHSDVKTTQIYTHILDKRKEEAIDKLPSF
jgi:site-specific recombinase XerD